MGGGKNNVAIFAQYGFGGCTMKNYFQKVIYNHNIRFFAMKRLSLLAIYMCLLCVNGMALTYRGMVDVALGWDWLHDVGRGIYGWKSGVPDESDYLYAYAISTTHGVQLNRHNYLGIGAEFSRVLEGTENLGSIPVYLMWRMDFFGKKVTPFFDVRAGYQLAKVKSFNGGVNGGIRIGFGSRTGLNISLGVRMRKTMDFVFDELDTFFIEPVSGRGKPVYVHWTDTAIGIALRVGVDF